MNAEHDGDLEVKLSFHDALEVELAVPVELQKVPPPLKKALQAELVARAGLQKDLSISTGDRAGISCWVGHHSASLGGSGD